MMISEISKLSTQEKFQLMEALWEDMRMKVDQCDIRQEHIDVLDSRRRAVDSGDDTILDWDMRFTTQSPTQPL